MQGTISKDLMKSAVKEVWIRSLTEIQPDILEALNAAREKETNERGRKYLDILIQNALLATQNRTVICQDTGVPTFFIKTSLGFPYDGDLREVFDEALHELTMGEFPMRPMVVHPLTREDRCDNTAANVPLLHIELDHGTDYMEIKAMPKGAGSGIWGTLQFFPPSVGAAGVKKFVVDSVLRAGSNPCPPIVLGVGVGGSFDKVAYLAKKALLRPLDVPNPDPYYADLEKELLTAINELGIGPQGFGGRTTCLGLAIEQMPTHVAGLPVAVNVSCHVTRRASAAL